MCLRATSLLPVLVISVLYLLLFAVPGVHFGPDLCGFISEFIECVKPRQQHKVISVLRANVNSIQVNSLNTSQSKTSLHTFIHTYMHA